jgi:hypothetical protein
MWRISPWKKARQLLEYNRVESIFQLDNDCNGLEPTLTKVFGQALNTMQPAGSEQDNFGLTVPEVR